MNVPRLNIEELYETKKKIDLNRLETYNKLLTKIHSKIKTASRQTIQTNFCSFVMPELLIGYPNYNFSECLNYIIDKLEVDHFLCKYIHPNLLLISWNHWVPSYVREQIKKNTGVAVDCYGNPIQNKTTVSFDKGPTFEKKNIYEDNLFNSMKN